MKTLLLLLCLSVGASGSRVEVHAPQEPGKQLTSLHFAVNTEFYRPGVFAGTLPEDDPRTKAQDFAAALKASGIHTLRMPGGDGVYYYLPEGRSQTMRWRMPSTSTSFATRIPPQNTSSHWRTWQVRPQV